MSEGVFTGFCGHGIHLPDDLASSNPSTPTGDPVAPGELSHRVLVTNLYNHTQPLIRFEVTDQVTLIDGTCPCGSSMGRIEDPQGRLDDTFVYEDGLSVHPHLFRSALGQHPAIIEYQVRQTHERRGHRHRRPAPVDIRRSEGRSPTGSRRSASPIRSHDRDRGRTPSTGQRQAEAVRDPGRADRPGLVPRQITFALLRQLHRSADRRRLSRIFATRRGGSRC